jgi:DnaA-homolog protein
MRQMALDIGLAPQPSLDNFEASGNEPAFRHLQLWTRGDRPNPVPTYLWGDSGSGKTHLLNGVRLAVQDNGLRVAWFDASRFDEPDFDERADIIILDDCHLYTAPQQAVAFNWFVNALNPADGRTRGVFSSGMTPPADLKLRDDLRSRLGWGHVFQLHALDENQRRAVLRRAADDRGVLLSDDVIDFMLRRFSRDLSSLMLLLAHLDQYALRTQRSVTVPLIKAMLEDE